MMMTNSKRFLASVLMAVPSLCLPSSAWAAEPNPTPKPDKAANTATSNAIVADDQPGPRVLIRGHESGTAAGPTTIAVAAPGSDGPVVVPAPGTPGLPGPGPNTFFFQRQVGGPAVPADGPDGAGPKMIIRLPEHGQFSAPDGRMITTGPGPNGMAFPLPDGKMNFTARAIWVDDPEMRRLLEQDAMFDHQSQELAEEYRHAPKDKLDEVKKKLEDVVSRQFDGRQERRSLELKQLEDQIKKIQASIDKRKAAKKQIVDRRVSEVLGQDDTSF